MPDLDRSTPTHTYDAMSWLLEPARGLQWGFTPGVFEVDRAGVIRGHIVERDSGDPVAGMEVSVLGHPEFGVTRTRVENGTTDASGYFELMVNGGDTYTLTFSHPDYLTAQRQIVMPWNGWLALPEVAVMERAELVG